MQSVIQYHAWQYILLLALLCCFEWCSFHMTTTDVRLISDTDNTKSKSRFMNFANLRSKSKADEAEKKVRIIINVDDPDLTVVLCDYIN